MNNSEVLMKDKNASKVIQEIVKSTSVDEKNRLLEKIKNQGLPLIENYDKSNSVVTVLFFGDDTINTVSVFGELFGTNEPVYMTKIEGTDVYYRSFIFPNDSRSLYVFFINELDDQELEDIDVRIDPYNAKVKICTSDPGFPNEYATLFREESILELPNCRVSFKHDKLLNRNVIEDSAIFNEKNRRFWIYSKTPTPTMLLIFFDGYEYLHETSSLQIIDELDEDVMCLFLDNRADRMGDLLYNDHYVSYIEKSVFPKAASLFPLPQKKVLVGFSLGANLALYMTLKYNYNSAILQSGAFYYNDEIIKEHFLFDLMSNQKKQDIILYISNGRLEREFTEFYKEILLIKDKSFNKEFITYAEHPGGHTYFDCDFTLKNGIEFFCKKTSNNPK